MKDTLTWQQTTGLDGVAPSMAAGMRSGPDVENGDVPGRDDQSEGEDGFDDERRTAREFGIGFDGRRYRYRAYRYDLFVDALNYAQLKRAKPGFREEAVVEVQWLDPEVPTDAEMHAMDELSISFDGQLYHYGDYRYERADDALNYARLMRR